MSRPKKSALESVFDTQVKAERDFYSRPWLWGTSLLGLLMILAFPIIAMACDTKKKKKPNEEEEEGEGGACATAIPRAAIVAVAGVVLLVLAHFVWVARNPKAAAQRSVAAMSWGMFVAFVEAMAQLIVYGVVSIVRAILAIES